MRGGNPGAGLILLGIWLILSGLIPLVGIRIPNAQAVLDILAVIAGILIIVGR
jgi:uncharacterized membrane protein